MEPLIMILIPGLFGGLILALLLAANRQNTRGPVVPRRLEAPSPALINMAHIKVEGVGGLGMVAAVVAVAVADPRIRLAIIMAAVLGTGLALCLIALRRRAAERPPSGTGSNGPIALHLDDERRPAQAARMRKMVDGARRPRAISVLHTGGMA